MQPGSTVGVYFLEFVLTIVISVLTVAAESDPILRLSEPEGGELGDDGKTRSSVYST